MNRPNMWVMAGMAFTVWTLLHAYVYLRLARAAPLGRRARVAVLAALAVSWLLPPLAIGLFGGPSAPGPAGWPVLWLAYSSIGLMGLLFPFVIVRDLVWLAAWIVRLVPRDPARARRVFDATSAAVAALAIACAVAGAVGGARAPRVLRVDLPVAGLPRELEGFRIAFFSDLHLGAVGRRSLSEGIVERVNAENPDVAVLGGDLADGMASALAADAAPLAGVRARSGRFFVTGNHEYFRDYAGWLALVAKLGYATLSNEHLVIRRGKARVLVGGIPDYRMSLWAGTPSDPCAAMKGAPRCDVSILLSHSPEAAPEAAACGWDFMVAGHSHGGQYFPWTLLFGNLPWYRLGFHDAGRMRLFVSAGAGSWGPPFRLGTRTDISILTLRRSTDH